LALEEEGEESRLLHLDTEEIGERIANTVAHCEGIDGVAGVRLENIVIVPGESPEP
jgi:hypothetical protein